MGRKASEKPMCNVFTFRTDDEGAEEIREAARGMSVRDFLREAVSWWAARLKEEKK